jgi:hypothetical protein
MLVFFNDLIKWILENELEKWSKFSVYPLTRGVLTDLVE